MAPPPGSAFVDVLCGPSAVVAVGGACGGLRCHVGGCDVPGEREPGGGGGITCRIPLAEALAGAAAGLEAGDAALVLKCSGAAVRAADGGVRCRVGGGELPGTAAPGIGGGGATCCLTPAAAARIQAATAPLYPCPPTPRERCCAGGAGTGGCGPRPAAARRALAAPVAEAAADDHAPDGEPKAALAGDGEAAAVVAAATAAADGGAEADFGRRAGETRGDYLRREFSALRPFAIISLSYILFTITDGAVSGWPCRPLPHRAAAAAAAATATATRKASFVPKAGPPAAHGSTAQPSTYQHFEHLKTHHLKPSTYHPKSSTATKTTHKPPTQTHHHRPPHRSA